MLKAKNTLGLVFFPAFDWAISDTHPEREERLLYTQDQIFEEGIEDVEGIKFFNPIIASEKDIARVHFAVPDIASRVTPSHLVAAGGAIRAYQAVMEKEVDKAFALVRPPGHHAHRIVYGDKGFCIVNVGAVALENIRQKYGDLKVAIVDTDVHHGDGTQDIYWNDKDTLFISFHQDGRTLYPGTGRIEEFGGPSAYGYNINIPLPPSTGEEGFLHILDNLVLPILDDFKPDLIINSAGQDNHYSDPLANMNFTAQGYAILNERLNPDLAVLEGGYSIESALPYINMGIILAMAGLDYSQVFEPDYDAERLKQDPAITAHIQQLSKDIYALWKNKDALAEEKFKGKTEVKREQQIYYDTAGVMEHQVQTFRICADCAGVNSIDSRNDNRMHIFAITLPRKACQSCIDKAYSLYNETSKSSYTHIYLQDRVNDKYLAK
ncbi:histone deacetylase [Pseudomonas sp. C27(2019)]|uniref:histone deacetylase family protein n=1 Tax=Pseudomonas sp. C27(2019) TaxID=2604941 RepID=UPI0012441D3D|nr:histone deacetylase [Pseudomonas sp. C27(2019)]QEY57684.1 histone deacetylase [Pseudomonas sp. C27(2019)]